MITHARDWGRGFLPTDDPLPALPTPCADWDAVGRDLPKLALSQHLRCTVETLPPFPPAALQTHQEYKRASANCNLIR
jgi:hypothetical protein